MNFGELQYYKKIENDLWGLIDKKGSILIEPQFERVDDYATGEFGKNYGLEIVDGPLQGLHSRAVIVVDEEGTVLYNQQVPEIVDEPNYEGALAVL